MAKLPKVQYVTAEPEPAEELRAPPTALSQSMAKDDSLPG